MPAGWHLNRIRDDKEDLAKGQERIVQALEGFPARRDEGNHNSGQGRSYQGNDSSELHAFSLGSRGNGEGKGRED